ncbi:hypothetical protein LOTGIDRAFT_239707 [Lottia gigantea]|uniref:VWFA domain-containing protein n=1 Tax=Lottia gigantea TaxID=225164 RepID=V3ZLM1_LOTGI|nr:hypothetical protein LOTGIDRAFT_239707 [Lottia gigantea]ESO83315.1 hypothetical protein LOTGIDRAFT_239707 [Lottia gigantea]
MGVISGSCPIDSGFSLNTYSSNKKIRNHLARYDSSRLPALIGSVPEEFNQARSGARKVAVIFIGGKVDAMAVIEQAEAAHAAGIDIFFAGHETADRNLLNALEEIGFGQRLFLNGYSARGQAAQFVEALCRMGLAYMRDHLFKKARPGVPHICIVITDGESQEPEKTAKEALGARQAGIDIFAIGVSESVNRQELNNIAGTPDRVIIVKTYGELEAIKDKLSGQTCKNVPTPAPTQAAEECGKDTPTDIYYVFDPASLGLDITGWVTQFISYTLEVREFKFMQMGVISGSCPIDSGFSLNTYSSNKKIRNHLARYDSSRLPALIGSVPEEFNQARSGARKVAVIFIGGKVRCNTRTNGSDTTS